jgi:hypothetical protein
MGRQINGIDVTPTEAAIFMALSGEPEPSYAIARKAGLKNMNRGETAAKFCISLTKKGLAQKHGSRMFPMWSKA